MHTSTQKSGVNPTTQNSEVNSTTQNSGVNSTTQPSGAAEETNKDASEASIQDQISQIEANLKNKIHVTFSIDNNAQEKATANNELETVNNAIQTDSPLVCLW